MPCQITIALCLKLPSTTFPSHLRASLDAVFTYNNSTRLSNPNQEPLTTKALAFSCPRYICLSPDKLEASNTRTFRVFATFLVKLERSNRGRCVQHGLGHRLSPKASFKRVQEEIGGRQIAGGPKQQNSSISWLKIFSSA